jgi:uncharacterized protein (TIGR00369 family)
MPVDSAGTGPYRAAGATRVLGAMPDGSDRVDPSRTLWTSWDNIADVAKRAPTMSGLELLQAISRGELPAPPIHHVLGIVPVKAEEGSVSFSMVPGEMHYNPMGVVHGGVLSLMLDSALGCSVLSALPAGTSYTTVDLHVTMTRAVTVSSGELRAEGRVLHMGRRVATAEGKLTDAKGRLVATAVTTCFLGEATR